MDSAKWHLHREGQGPEEVALENWIWAVQYEDGSELHQFDDQGRFHQIREIEQARARLWVLYQPQGKGDGRIDIVIPQGKEVDLIHKYRNIVFEAATPGEYRERVYVFGYKVKGCLPHYNFILPSGLIIQSYGEDHPKLGTILARPETV